MFFKPLVIKCSRWTLISMRLKKSCHLKSYTMSPPLSSHGWFILWWNQICMKTTNGWFSRGRFPANILANVSSSFFRVVLSLSLTIESLSPRFIDVRPITAAAMALMPPDVDASNGNSISFARWATRNSQHLFPTSSASNSTCMTTKMRIRNHVL